jgi:hypothetical protein
VRWLIALPLLGACMTATQVSKPKWEVSAKVAGGFIGDVALAGTANFIQAERAEGDEQWDNHFWTYFGVLFAVDLAAFVILHAVQK